MHSDVTYLAALVAGFVSFLSPCVLPLVPPYLVFLAGTTLERFADKEAEPRIKRETVAAAVLFVLGFSTVFVALGASASVIGSLIRAYSGPLATIAGIAIIVMGLHFLGVTPIALLHRQKRLEVGKPVGLWGAYVIGLAFAFGWTPCIGPILAAILAVAAFRADRGEGCKPPCSLFAGSRDAIHRRGLCYRTVRGFFIPLSQPSAPCRTSHGRAARVDGDSVPDRKHQPGERVAARGVPRAWQNRLRKTKARRLAGPVSHIFAIRYFTLVQSEPGHST